MKTMFKRSAISVSISMCLLGGGTFASSALAQEDNKDVERIEVTGIKGSLQRGLMLKQNSANFVDAISAEDVGKLPDHNIAEALQRVTGVSIQRSRGEGDFVSIRGLGPDFVRGTVNGRSMVSATESFDSTLSGGSRSSTGRATNFDVLPAEVISTLEVIKSPSAEHVEGGIGGIVNIKTARPLSVDNKFVVSAKGTYREFEGDTDPNLSALYSWVNDESDFGILTSVSYSQRNIREDFSRSFGWLPWGTYDTNADGAADRDALIPLSNNLDSYQETRDRITVNSTMQWTIDDSSEVIFDILYSDRSIEHDEQSAILVALPVGYSANPDGSFVVDSSQFNGTALPNILSSLPPELVSDQQKSDDSMLNLGLQYIKQLGEWQLTTDFSYADASGSLDFDRAVIVGNGDADGGNYFYDFNVNQDGFAVDYTGKASLSNPGNYFLRNGRVTRTENDDSEFAVQFDAERDIDSDFISAIKTGFRYRNRDKEIKRSDFDGGLGDFAFTDITGDSHFNGISNFMDGSLNNNFDYSDMIFANPQVALAYAAQQGIDIVPKQDALGTYDIQEQTYAAYFQVDLDGSIGDVGFIGDFGFRLVYTQQDVNGLSRPFTIDGTTTPGSLVFTSPDSQNVSFDDSYLNVLPSLNLRFEVQEDLYLRVAASKSLTRPTFSDLAPSIAINPSATVDLNGDGIAATANMGNPNLAPYESTNFDIGFEWYFGDASALYAGIFYKEIEDFIATVTNLDTEVEGTVFDSVSQPDNQGTAQLTGLEVGLQDSYESGFGYLVNISLTENDAEFEEGGDIPFPGVSDYSYNATVYYDNDGFEARLAYSYRDDYLLLASDVFANQVFTEGYGQLDASISYEVSDGIDVYLEAVNLTDNNAKLFTSNEDTNLSQQFLSESHVGRRLGLGIRASF
ncbi:TonB-dependent receptor [Parashewanella spongiae]|uniref:TonB-dependent receptor n=1 Tax=Parashewanella spongiae TaxID=342950 RepID=A0A3A6TVT7_9GAMM|nr:TonB-dependent receptor [Parashewanella spongiae]MCL1077938.1 TonB-dependent receptor [Parashewanella spongiae]RJY18442.1 TonB-dependent receptor [Parashewanella spongiae]